MNVKKKEKTENENRHGQIIECAVSLALKYNKALFYVKLLFYQK